MADAAQRIIVKFKVTPNDAHTFRELCDEVAKITGGSLLRRPSHTGRAVFQVPATSDLAGLIEQIQKLPAVEYAEADVIDRSVNN